MEKTFQLDQREVTQSTQMDQERTQVLAMVGALSLDMEQAKKNLEMATERQRAFIRQLLNNRGVERYDQARIQNNTLFATVPDEAPAPPAAPAEPARPPERVNGPTTQRAAKE